jgi:hypothetical protein
MYYYNLAVASLITVQICPCHSLVCCMLYAVVGTIITWLMLLVGKVIEVQSFSSQRSTRPGTGSGKTCECKCEKKETKTGTRDRKHKCKLSNGFAILCLLKNLPCSLTTHHPHVMSTFISI